MSEQRKGLARLFAACWKDEGLKARFKNDPKAVLKEHGLDVPDGIDVKVVENSVDHVHITLPAAPPGLLGLTDEELRKAAGGGTCHRDSGPDAAIPLLQASNPAIDC